GNLLASQFLSGGACRAATSPSAQSGRNGTPQSGVAPLPPARRARAPLRRGGGCAALLLAARRVPPLLRRDAAAGFLFHGMTRFVGEHPFLCAAAAAAALAG